MASRLRSLMGFGSAGALISRFPLPILISLVTIVLYWNSVGKPAYQLESNFDAALFGLRPFGASAFLVAFASALLKEALGSKASLAAVIVGMAAVVVVSDAGHWTSLLFTPGVYHSHDPRLSWRFPAELYPAPTWFFLLGGLSLSLLLAPYATARRSPASFWQFSHKLFVALAAAFIGAYLAWGGVAAVLMTFELLFEIKMPWTAITQKALVIANLGVAPVIWLILTPAGFDDVPKRGQERETTSKAVSLLVRYILIPSAVALSLLLAAYIVKVIATGAFASARLGLGGVAYGSGIVLVALLSYPEREDSTAVRYFWRLWPVLTIAPTLLSLIALKIRIAEYGWSPLRYFAFLMALWLAIGIVASLVWRGRMDLRIIPASLAILLFLASAGPWSAINVTGRSQSARLIALLTGKGAVKDGRWITEGAPNWTQNELNDVRGLISELDSARQMFRLASLFEETAGKPFSSPDLRAALETRLGADIRKATIKGWERAVPSQAAAVPPATPRPAGPAQPRPYFQLSAPTSPLVMRIERSWLLGPFSLAAVASTSTACFTGGCAELRQNGLVIDVTVSASQTGTSARTSHFDLTQLLGPNTGDAAKNTQVVEAKEARTVSGEGDSQAALKVVALNVNTGASIEVLSGLYYLVVPQF